MHDNKHSYNIYSPQKSSYSNPFIYETEHSNSSEHRNKIQRMCKEQNGKKKNTLHTDYIISEKNKSNSGTKKGGWRNYY